MTKVDEILAKVGKSKKEKKRIGVQVWLDPDKKDAFRKRLDERGLTAQEVLEATIDLFLEE